MIRSRMARPARPFLTLALGVLLVGASACFVLNRASKPDQSASLDIPAGEFALRVTNHNYLDVAVYVVHGGQRTRVGTVTGSSSALFFLPDRLLGLGREIQLYGEAIGGGEASARTHTLIVQPGQYIDWTLETDLRRSSVGVY